MRACVHARHTCVRACVPYVRRGSLSRPGSRALALSLTLTTPRVPPVRACVRAVRAPEVTLTPGLTLTGCRVQVKDNPEKDEHDVKKQEGGRANPNPHPTPNLTLTLTQPYPLPSSPPQP